MCTNCRSAKTRQSKSWIALCRCPTVFFFI